MRVLPLLLAVVWISLPATASGAGARLFKSGPVQITADGRWVWVANEDNDSVSRLDTSDDSIEEYVLPALPHGQRPRGLALLEDGSEVWVACHDSDYVYVLRGTDGDLLARIDLPWGSGPFSAAISRDQATAVVTLHRAEAVAVIDVASRGVIKIVEPVYRSPMGIAFTEAGNSAWVTHLFAPGEHPLITRIDLSSSEPSASTSVQIFATDPRQSSDLAAPYDIAEGGYLTTRGHPAQIPTATGRNEIWLPTQYNNIHEDVFTPDSTVQATIRRLDLATRRVPNANSDKVILSAVHMHEPSGNNAYLGPGWNAEVAGPIDIAFSDDGSITYFLSELSNDLVVLPSDTPTVKPNGAAPLPEIPVGDRPMGLAVSPVEEIAYVYNLLSRDLSVVDLENLSELRRLPLTPTTGEPLSPTVLKGAKLFHTSDDPRISSNSKVACASCHLHAEHDGRSWAFQHLPGAHGPREVPSLLGLALSMGPVDPTTGFGQLHRSGDRDEVQDFELTFQGVTMGGTGFLADAVQPELGAPNAGRDADLDAIADYLFSLEPVRRSPYRQPDGTLSEAAERGATFFVGANRATHTADANCAGCHVPETGFVDLKFHNVGQRVASAENELDSRTPANHVNTPTLVGVWTTPPYNGTSGFAPDMLRLLLDQANRATTSTPHGTPDGLSGRQLLDLAEFVLSIDGNMTPSEVRGARDTTAPRIVRVEVATLTQIDVWFNETVDRVSVEDVSHWRLVEAGGDVVPITSARWDSRMGGRVSLATTLRPSTNYVLTGLSAITDAAGSASNGVANALDENDPANQRALSVGTTLTVTLGSGSGQNIAVAVHDTAMVGPGLSTWSHDSLWLFPVNSGPRLNTAFLRFDWRDAFVESTGVVHADQIVDARIVVPLDFGDARTLELRRCLQPWSDPSSGGDWNRSATGAPTWRDHAHPSARWNQSGAGALGGDGSRVSDYGGAFDLAAQVDATTAPESSTDEVFVLKLARDGRVSVLV